LQVMTRVMSALQTMALSHHLAILLVDHHRKPGFVSDPIDDVMGSTGKAAVADCALGLYRERGKPGATLRVTGRDMPEADMALSWDGLLHCWQYSGPADQVREDSERGRVLAAVRELRQTGELPTGARVSEITGMAKQNVSATLQDLVMDGLIRRGAKVGVQQPFYPLEDDKQEDYKDYIDDNDPAM